MKNIINYDDKQGKAELLEFLTKLINNCGSIILDDPEFQGDIVEDGIGDDLYEKYKPSDTAKLKISMTTEIKPGQDIFIPHPD